MQTKYDLKGFEKDPAVRTYLQGDRFVTKADDLLVEQENVKPKKEPKK